jgi:hypothetical protein
MWSKDCRQFFAGPYSSLLLPPVPRRHGMRVSPQVYIPAHTVLLLFEEALPGVATARSGGIL